MKIKSIRLERYKRFEDRTFDFTHPYSGKPLDLVVLVGENGCGKSSILQAIAATLGTATGQILSPYGLTWDGFNITGIDANYRGKSEITLDIVFSEDELVATREYYDIYNAENPLPKDTFWDGVKISIANARPTLALSHTLKLEHGQNEITSDYEYGVKAYGWANEFRGRKFAQNLIQSKRQSSTNLFQRVGGIFWYPEYRTFYSINLFDDSSQSLNTLGTVIRRLITNWFAEDGQARIKKFREIYQMFFNTRRLLRIEPFSTTIDPFIYFEETTTKHIYELSELSAGERSILPIIIDFVQNDISNSVILIDELELHLHPPLQQSLLSGLEHLGTNNQFIITTHSNYISNLVPSSRIIRVDDVK